MPQESIAQNSPDSTADSSAPSSSIDATPQDNCNQQNCSCTQQPTDAASTVDAASANSDAATTEASASADVATSADADAIAASDTAPACDPAQGYSEGTDSAAYASSCPPSGCPEIDNILQSDITDHRQLTESLASVVEKKLHVAEAAATAAAQAAEAAADALNKAKALSENAPLPAAYATAAAALDKVAAQAAQDAKNQLANAENSVGAVAHEADSSNSQTGASSDANAAASESSSASDTTSSISGYGHIEDFTDEALNAEAAAAAAAFAAGQTAQIDESAATAESDATGSTAVAGAGVASGTGGDGDCGCDESKGEECQQSDTSIVGLSYGPCSQNKGQLPELKMEEAQNFKVLTGIPASRGIAVGRISFLQRDVQQAARRTIEDVDAEVARFEKAREEAIAQLGALYETTVEKLGDQNAVVFQIHQMMLDDPEYVDAIENAIREEKVNAEYAVETTGSRFADIFRQMEDNDYMQGRAADVMDVSRRLSDILNQSSGFNSPHQFVKSEEPILLATDDLAPSETVQLDQNLVRGIITSAGSARSHTVIFARTLGLPAVINIGSELTPDLEGKMAIVDGATGRVILDPDEKTLALYAERKRTEDALRARLEQFRGKETKTLSGRKIHLYANIGAVSDIDLVKSSDAEGIGLFRSEYIYLQSQDYPDEETQFNIYKEALLAMDGKKVVIRTLDIGADKTADYFMLKHEENPAMGMRAIRICLTRPEIFITQLRALYRASVYGTLAIMFPMITSVEEVKDCIRMCDEVKAALAAEGKEYSDNVELGIMIETPASAVISDLLAEHVDFFSIGTNDLTQFTLAVDRQNADVGRFLNPYHRAVIRLIEMTVTNAHKHGIWVGVCGELAADEGFTHELIRIGVDEISVVPSSVLMIRARIATLG